MSSKYQSVTGFHIDNRSFLKDSKEGVYVSPIIKHGPFVNKLAGSKCCFDLFQNSVKRQRNTSFLGWHASATDPFHWLTYEEVNRQVEACGSGFVKFEELTRSSEPCIGLYSANRPEWLIAELACWGYGFVAVPLYDTLGVMAIQNICNETELSVVVCDTPDRAKKLLCNAAALTTLRRLIILAPGGELESLRSIAPSCITITSYNELLEQGTKYHIPPRPKGEDGLIVICYTSGTTGKPKGAMVHNRNLLAQLAASFENVGPAISKDDTLISFLPLAHMYEQYIEIYAMTLGMRIGYIAGSVLQLRDDLQTLRPTVFPVVPKLLYRLYDHVMDQVSKSKLKRMLLSLAIKQKCKVVDKQVFNVNSVWDSVVFSKIRHNFGGRVRFIILTSAAIAPHVLRFTRAVFSCPVIEGYGATETLGPASMSVGGDLKGGCVGSPIPSLAIKLVDVPSMDIVAQRDNKGEICVRGVSCISGYYKNPEATAELIDSDGWLHTGDIGTWNDGSLKIIDRCKHIFKLAQGEYVAPEKVEQVYLRSPLVNQVFVDGSSLQSYPVALVIPNVEALNRAIADLVMENGKKTTTTQQPIDPVEICAKPEAERLILEEFDKLATEASLMGFEKVKNVKLIPEEFSVENLLLTPTQKTARPIVRRRYAGELAELCRLGAALSN